MRGSRDGGPPPQPRGSGKAHETDGQGGATRTRRCMMQPTFEQAIRLAPSFGWSWIETHTIHEFHLPPTPWSST
ncbi:Uncharacterized protein TCM_038130 [Theobroma cacao]|uniref:Uncharacterized protein n=1 Tax=Theobroma cacao TaxID=3641 RepID=A0A061GPS0_THECC|nr:Uncharacterized protein TCM_038130 [Theobroma cacao]